jgi:hypothetical protein
MVCPVRGKIDKNRADRASRKTVGAKRTEVQKDGALNVITRMAHRVCWRDKSDVLIDRAFYQFGAAGMYISQFKIKQRVTLYLA